MQTAIAATKTATISVAARQRPLFSYGLGGPFGTNKIIRQSTTTNLNPSGTEPTNVARQPDHQAIVTPIYAPTVQTLTWRPSCR